MERWCGRVAAVTGAGAGIGFAVVRALIRHGLNVVAMDVNTCKLKEMADSGCAPKLHVRKVDVSKEKEIAENFCWMNQKLGRVDILVNNAGVFRDKPLTEECTENFRRMLNVNVLGLTLCTNEALRLMCEKCIDDGHIVNICSMVGHRLPGTSEEAFYTATKHAVRALSEGYRRELMQRGTHTRITQISPGVVETELFNELHRFQPERLMCNPHLKPEDIANAVLFALGAPPKVQITEVIVLPVGQKMLGEM